MRIRDARAIALEAVARGWLSPAELWELAARWARQGDEAASHALFEGSSLDPLRLASLVAESTKQVETIPYSTDAGDPKKRETQPRARSERPASPSQPPGPRYKIGELLGAGGVGLVTSALDRTIGRTVAVKTLKQGKESEAQVSRRFIDEAHVTAQLEHPNIVPVYDMGWLPDGQPYYTMRIVKRQSLRDVLVRPEVKAQWPAHPPAGRLHPDRARARLRPRARDPAPRHQARERAARRLRRGVPGRLGPREAHEGREPGDPLAPRQRAPPGMAACPRRRAARPGTSPPRSCATSSTSTRAPTCSRSASCSTSS